MSVPEYDVRRKIDWLRTRADEVLAIADGMRYPPARNPLVRVAETYEKAASQLENLISNGTLEPDRQAPTPDAKRVAVPSWGFGFGTGLVVITKNELKKERAP